MSSRRHIVQDGEDAASVARRYGLRDTAAIWDMPDNQSLRSRRPNENQLFPGDVLWVPRPMLTFRAVREKAATTFTLTLPRRSLRLAIVSTRDEALRSVPFEVVGSDGATVASGNTTDDGVIECEVPVDDRDLTIALQGHGRFAVRAGALNPMRFAPDGGRSGCSQRLAALGYAVGRGAEDTIALTAAIARFRRDRGMPASESLTLDDELFAALEQAHGQ